MAGWGALMPFLFKFANKVLRFLSVACGFKNQIQANVVQLQKTLTPCIRTGVLRSDEEYRNEISKAACRVKTTLDGRGHMRDILGREGKRQSAGSPGIVTCAIGRRFAKADRPAVDNDRARR